MIKKHRNSQKRIYFKDAVYFVTTSTGNWYSYFKEQIFCDLFAEELRLCKQMKKFRLFAWFLGYDHFHMLIQPGDEFNYSDVMQFLKRNFSRNANYVMGFNKYDELSIGNTGDNHHCRVRKEGISIFKCDNHPQPEGDNDRQSNENNYPEGDNDDCRISGTDNLRRFVYKKFIFRFRFKLKYLNNNPFPKFRWLKSFNDHFSRNNSDFDEHWTYIKWNPQKHNMPDNWSYIFMNPKYADLTDESI